MRIGRALSRLGLCSRRGAADFLKENKVSYRGERISRLDFDLPENTVIVVNGKQHKLQERIVILLNKPAGYVCSHRAQKGQRTIFELLPADIPRLFYAGRLDIESRGLVVLSNDGDLVHQLTHPSHGILKEYLVHLSRPLSPKELQRCQQGIWDRKEKLTFHSIEPTDVPAHYVIELKEGKNREIRRAVKRLGVEVLDLQRTHMGEYELGSLPEGQSRPVNPTT